MGYRVVGSFLLTLGLLLVVAVGGVAGDAQHTEVPVAEGLHDADGEVEAIVTFGESDTATTPAELQAHAGETQQPLVEFAEDRPGVEVVNQFWITNAALVTVDTDRAQVRDLAAVDGVESIVENAEFETHTHRGGGFDPDEPLGAGLVSDEVTDDDYTYGLEQINAPEAWEEHGTQGEGASVAVLDTGVDTDHPDLAVEKWAHFDGDGDPVDSEPNDGDGHGTHVTGTVAGPEDPAGSVPAYGVAPEADIYGVKVLDDGGGGTFAQIIAGMEWAVEEDADVISMSLGATGTIDQMIDPVLNAHDAGTLVVASAGNSGEGSSGSPGNVYDAVSVGASNEAGDIADFSSGEVIDTSTWNDPPAHWPDQYVVPSVAAPGVDVLSSVPGGGYDDTYSGTSMAAPHVSGAVALAVSASDEALSPEFIEEGLEATAFKPGDSPAPPGERDTRYGSGIIDANAFVSFVDDGDGPLLTVSASAPDVVETDEDLEVDYEIENLGGETGTESAINLLLDGSIEDSDTDITVEPGEVVTGTLVYDDVEDHEEGDILEWTVELVDAGASTSGTTAVGAEPEPEIVIESIDHPDQISVDDDLSVEYTLENLGLEDGTESFVDLLVEGTDSTFDDTDSSVEVPAGETVDGTLTFDEVAEYFGDGDVITFEVELWDFGDVEEGTAEVGEESGEPELVITEADAPAEIELDDDLEVDYEVENVGGETGDDLVDLFVDAEDGFVDYDSIEVDPGETADGTLVFDEVAELYEDGETIEWSVELFSFGDVADGETDVGEDDPVEGPELVIADIAYDDPLAVGEEMVVDYTLENVGDEDGTETFVDLLVEGTDSAFDDTDTSVEVPAGETVDGTLTFDEMDSYFEPGDEITFSVELWDYGDVEEGATTVEVPDEPVISLVSITAPTEIEAGDPLEVDYTLENIGAEPGTESAVNLLVEDDLEDTDEAVEVPAEGTAEGTLTFEDTGELLTFVEAADAELSESTAFDGPAIDGEVRKATGEERLLVALDTPAADDIEALQDAVDAAAAPVVDFAETTRNADLVQVSWLAETVSLDVDLDTVDVAALADIPSVEHVTTSPTFEAQEAVESAPRDGVVRDSEYTYGLEQVNAPETWATHGTQGEGVSVAVLDTGVDDDHPDLTVDEWAEFDGDGDPVDSEPNDGDGHGTHVAGTVVGPTDPAGDVPGYGVAPAADLHGVKVLGDTGGGSFEQIIAGMEWAVEDGDSDIISMSLGATGYVPEMIDPVTNAVDAGVPVVSSAGNSGEGSSGSPGNVYDAISVGASDETEGIAGFSSGEVIDTDSAWGGDAPGHWPDEYTVPSVAAPGVDVLSSVPGGGYDGTYSGTSMAAPHVSGVVALAMSAADEELSPTLVEQTLESTAFKPDDAPAPPGERDTRYGSGIVDALAAVDELSDPPEGELVEFTVEAVDAGDSLGGTVFVEEPEEEPPEEPELVITEVDAPGEIELDEDLAVDYEVENVGGETDSDFVDLFVDAEDDFVDFDSIEVDPGEVVTGTLTFEEVAEFYEEGETIEWSVELFSFDDVAEGETGIAGEPPGEAEFLVQDVDLTTPVAGEDLEALVTVENVGDDTDTQTVELDVEDLGTDATDLELGAGESGEAELAVGTEESDAGEYDATVATEDDEETAPVLVLAPPEFTVDVLDHTEEVVAGETVEVTAEIENVGDVDDTQTVELDIEGLGSDAVEVELPFGESTEETFAVDTEEGDAGEYDATVASEDDSDSVGVTVLAPALFEVDIVETNEPVEGADLDVTVAVENVGDLEGAQVVELDVEGLGDDQTELTLEGGESTEETLSVGTEEGDAGEYEAVVTSEDDTDTAVVEVVVDTEFLVVDIETNAPIIEGEDLDVTATVENAGEVAGTETVTASIEGIDEDSETVDLEAGATAEVEFTLETEIEDVGEYDLVVATGDDEATEVVELQLPTLPNQDAPPNDLNGDGEFEDVRGTGVFDIFDVLVFFNYYQAPEVQNHVHAYDFNDDGQVTVFDVQALFQKLVGGLDSTADTSLTRDSASMDTGRLAVA